VPVLIELVLAGPERNTRKLGEQVRAAASELAQLLDSGSMLLRRL